MVLYPSKYFALTFEHFRNRFLYATRSAPILNAVNEYNTVLYLEESEDE